MPQDFLSIKRFCILVAVLALPLALGACGDSDNSEANEITVEASSLSKAQFVERADEMCTKSKAQALRELQAFEKGNKLPPQSSPQEEEAWLGELIDTALAPIYEELIDQLSALGAPEGDEQEIAGFLRTIRRTLDDLEEEPLKLQSFKSPFIPAAEQATKYGLQGCASSLA